MIDINYEEMSKRGQKGGDALASDKQKKSEAAKKAAATRGHDAMAEMGRKGGLALAHDKNKKSEASRRAAATRGHDAMSAMGREGGKHSHMHKREEEK